MSGAHLRKATVSQLHEAVADFFFRNPGILKLLQNFFLFLEDREAVEAIAEFFLEIRGP